MQGVLEIKGFPILEFLLKYESQSSDWSKTNKQQIWETLTGMRI